MPRICLDAGHNNSGIDTGAQGNGLREELLTLDICQRIKPLLRFNGFEVVMTREGDFVNGPHGTVNESLQTRCFIANSAQANLFVSVHINAGGGSGTEIFIAGSGGQAERAANMVLPYLVSAGGWANRGIKVENLYVLKNTNMPAILTENGFIDTFSDAAKLADTDFRQKIAVAHAKGICDYFGVQYKEGGINVPNHVIAFWSAKDYSAAIQISERLNNCLMTCRNAKPDLNPDAKAAKHLIVVGGPEVTDHPNVTNLCGATGPDTAILAANYAKSL
jgi:N-acetylmuramoyl-L-alanine amidase